VGGRHAAATSIRHPPKPPPQVRRPARLPSCRAGVLDLLSCLPTHLQAVAVAGAGELALVVLAASGPPQLAILGHLELDDRRAAVKGALAWMLASCLRVWPHCHHSLYALHFALQDESRLHLHQPAAGQPGLVS
jgi:hypothetical protein